MEESKDSPIKNPAVYASFEKEMSLVDPDISAVFHKIGFLNYATYRPILFQISRDLKQIAVLLKELINQPQGCCQSPDQCGGGEDDVQPK